MQREESKNMLELVMKFILRLILRPYIATAAYTVFRAIENLFAIANVFPPSPKIARA